MHAPTGAQRFADAQQLLDYGFAGYTMADVHPDAPLPAVDVLLGRQEQVQPRLAQSCRILLEKQQAAQLSTRLSLCENVQAPVEEGQVLGQLEVYVGEQLRQAIPIVAAQGCERLNTGDMFLRLLRCLLMHP